MSQDEDNWDADDDEPKEPEKGRGDNKDSTDNKEVKQQSRETERLAQTFSRGAGNGRSK